MKAKRFKKRISAIIAATLAMSLVAAPTMASDLAESVPVVSAEADSMVDSIPEGAEATDSMMELAEEEVLSDDYLLEEADSIAEADSAVEDADSSVSSNGIEEAEDEEDVAAGYNEKGSVTMYRLYNPNTGEHFYTKDANEAKSLRFVGWKYEGIGWVAPAKSDAPVYRLYNANAGDHHYTLNSHEKDALVKVGWKYEGIGWYSASTNKVKILRQYNPNAKAGSHNFTTSVGENNALVKAGWKAEGVAWYALKGTQPKFSGAVKAVTTYKGVDYSAIYNFDYFRKANPSLKFGAEDDAEALEYFVTKGLQKNMQGKSGVTSSNATYQKLRNQYLLTLDPIQKYASNTNYIIGINSDTHTVKVYQGSQYNWTEIYSTACTLGAPATPTYKGVFMTRYGGYYFDSGTVRCFYYTPFNGSIYFHSVLYAQTSSPSVLMDGRLGVNISHGCVRLPIASAKYIYDKFGNSANAEARRNHNTTVVVY